MEIMLKTYSKDYSYVGRFMESFNRFNRDSIPLKIVCPKNDVSLFNEFLNKSISIIPEEELGLPLINEIKYPELDATRYGYLNQQIIKLGFWEYSNSNYYLAVDSDLVFIRNFSISDFLFDENTPYIPLVEDNDLRLDSQYYLDTWVPRSQAIQRIAEKLDYSNVHLLTCHGNTLMSKKYLNSFKQEFLEPNRLNYDDIIINYGAEFTWYNLYIQNNFWGNFKICEPFFKVYHSERDFSIAQLTLTKLSDLERSYVGVIVNSNFSRAFGPLKFEGSPLKTIAKFIHLKDLVYFNLYVIRFSLIRFLSFFKLLDR